MRALGQLALTVDGAKNVGLIVVVALVAFALLAMWAVRSVASKLIMVALLGALVYAVWTERAEVSECAKQVIETGTGKCRFFGREIQLPQL